MGDKDIDLSEVPEITPDQMKGAVLRVGGNAIGKGKIRVDMFLDAEIVAAIAAEAFTDLDAPVERLATPDCPIRYHQAMMEAVLPSTDGIRARMQELLEF